MSQWEDRIRQAYDNDTLHEWKRYEYVECLKSLKLPVKKDKMFILYQNICNHFSLIPVPEHCTFLSQCRSLKKKRMTPLDRVSKRYKLSIHDKLEQLENKFKVEKNNLKIHMKKVYLVPIEEDILSYQLVSDTIKTCIQYIIEIEKKRDIIAAEHDIPIEEMNFEEFERQIDTVYC
jgi:hypothetical protein